jgi:hypothetical protein
MALASAAVAEAICARSAGFLFCVSMERVFRVNGESVSFIEWSAPRAPTKPSTRKATTILLVLVLLVLVLLLLLWRAQLFL